MLATIAAVIAESQNPESVVFQSCYFFEAIRMGLLQKTYISEEKTHLPVIG